MLTQSPLRRSLLAGVAASLLGTAAFANQVQFSDTIPLQTTNWNGTLTIPQFDTNQGVLNFVSVRFETNILGRVGVENTSPNPQTLTATLQATISLQAPGGAPLLTSVPSSPVNPPPLTVFDGTVDFGGTSGYTSPQTAANDVQVVGFPPDGVMTLAQFQGAGSLVFPVAAQGSSFFTGNTGNEASFFELQAGARLVVTYDFTPPKTDCIPATRDVPGSLLLYPRFDNRQNNLTLVTVTNTNCDFTQTGLQLFAGTVDVEFVYIGKYGPGGQVLPCLETNRTRRLTPCDTITVVTRFDNPNVERGFLYVFAKDPQTGQAIVWNHLIGQAMFIGGGDLDEDPARDALNARPFLGIGRQGAPTDRDGDQIRDLDGIEYSEAPEQILIPRFLGQQEGEGGDSFKSRLVLIGLSGGIQFNTIVYILGYNDNEVAFSTQYEFRCWDDPRLSQINGGFTESFLDSTDNAPDEILGANGKESGWIRIDGQIAYSTQDVITDPAIYAVLFERVGPYVVADLPWELCTQPNGDLFPKDLFAEQP
ncbi:MAG: choice-of-anchor E domain-containing protein [Planctomycetes bacterium]|nr:choice-of-anchor E domain-containing protein [Planctomycetota bacterium]